jgi:squalene synthase HpnC
VNSSFVFTQELDRWGPGASTGGGVSEIEAEAYCRELTRSHYENFPIVSWLLPRRLHTHFQSVYAFCRWADDLADEVPDKKRSLELLAWWRTQLHDCYASRPTIGEHPGIKHPVYVALAKTISECEIPIEPFDDLISAFEQDQHIGEYSTFEELQAYCRRSANPVGRIVLHLIGQVNERNLAWSDSICTGLQLANFWQDVSRDFDIGRVYLPREDREKLGYSDDSLQRRETNDAFIALMQYEVDRAAEFLRAGMPLVDALPGRLQIDIELFARGGLKILEQIERIGYRVWETRPTVTKWDAVNLFCLCLARGCGRTLGLCRTNPMSSRREEASANRRS